GAQELSEVPYSCAFATVFACTCCTTRTSNCAGCPCELEAQGKEERKREEAEPEACAEVRREAAERGRREVVEAEQAHARAQAASAPPAPAPPSSLDPPTPPAPGTNPGKTNPFSNMMASGSTAYVSSPPAANGGTKPFFKRHQAGAALSPSPAPLAPPVAIPPPCASSAQVRPRKLVQCWRDSSDGKISGDCDTGAKIAQQLFGSILPTRRLLLVRDRHLRPVYRVLLPLRLRRLRQPRLLRCLPLHFAPPRAPGTLAAQPPPAVAPRERGALLSTIQGHERPQRCPVGGRVIGDSAISAHIKAAPVERAPSPSHKHPPPPPPPAPAGPGYDANRVGNRQSLNRYADLAVDQGVVSREPSGLKAPREEDGDEAATQANGDDPEIEAHESATSGENVVLTAQVRRRVVVRYLGRWKAEQGNVVFIAHPRV
ncbi:unnamed protein product, partial [Peniophora sp. CBMAI 1063]